MIHIVSILFTDQILHYVGITEYRNFQTGTTASREMDRTETGTTTSATTILITTPAVYIAKSALFRAKLSTFIAKTALFRATLANCIATFTVSKLVTK